MERSTPVRTSRDVLVVGGGLAGLTAAAHAARAGAHVTLLERGKSLGGRASTQERDGFRLNQGAHALYRGGVGWRVLRELGITVRGGVPAPNGGFALAGGVKHAFPGGFLSLLSSGLLSWAGKIDVARILAALPRMDTSPYDHRTVADAVASLSSRTDVHQLLLALVRLSSYGNDPARQSAGDALAQLQLAFAKNVLYLDGGWQTMVDALRDAAVAAGAEIESGARVDRVESDDAGVRVSLGDGRTFHGSAVVLATSPREAADLVRGAAKRALEGWAAGAIPALAACLDVCVDALPVPRATFALGIDQPVYLSVHSAVANLAPEGGGLIQCMKYLGAEPGADPARDERDLESTLDLVQPGWRARVVHKRFLPHMVVVHGLSTAAHGGVGGRPGPSVDEDERVFVAGDWVGPEGLLGDASLASGRSAGRLAAAVRTSEVAAA